MSPLGYGLRMFQANLLGAESNGGFAVYTLTIWGHQFCCPVVGYDVCMHRFLSVDGKCRFSLSGELRRFYERIEIYGNFMGKCILL